MGQTTTTCGPHVGHCGKKNVWPTHVPQVGAISTDTCGRRVSHLWNVCWVNLYWCSHVHGTFTFSTLIPSSRRHPLLYLLATVSISLNYRTHYDLQIGYLRNINAMMDVGIDLQKQTELGSVRNERVGMTTKLHVEVSKTLQERR